MMTRTCDIDSVFAAIHPHYDLFFIGGGLSSTLTLIQVLRELESMPTANDPPCMIADGESQLLIRGGILVVVFLTGALSTRCSY